MKDKIDIVDNLLIDMFGKDFLTNIYSVESKAENFLYKVESRIEDRNEAKVIKAIVKNTEDNQLLLEIFYSVDRKIKGRFLTNTDVYRYAENEFDVDLILLDIEKKSSNLINLIEEKNIFNIEFFDNEKTNIIKIKFNKNNPGQLSQRIETFSQLVIS